jgi:hypothetical protein
MIRAFTAVKNFDTPMLTRVWQELEYRIYVCLVACGDTAHQTSLVVEKSFQFSCDCEQFH